ncbi:MAG TPA: hypothetical protein VHF89_04695 [Solirubrobacteraceae bacterium]|nr:hypothetical protein [Solirubrobacteraceae bacterium]
MTVDVDVPFFLHVLGAMVLVGSLLLAATALAGAWRAEDAAAVRLGYRALLLGALPAWVVMRVAAQWLVEEGGYDDGDRWVEIGYQTSEGTLLLLIAATVLAGLSARRAQAGGRVRAAVVLVGIVIAVYAVTIWAMTTKPL